MDLKQNEWIDVEAKKNASTNCNVVQANSVPLGSNTNRFLLLNDEVSSAKMGTKILMRLPWKEIKPALLFK